jgi:hypothetical protein
MVLAGPCCGLEDRKHCMQWFQKRAPHTHRLSTVDRAAYCSRKIEPAGQLPFKLFQSVLHSSEILKSFPNHKKPRVATANAPTTSQHQHLACDEDPGRTHGLYRCGCFYVSFKGGDATPPARSSTLIGQSRITPRVFQNVTSCSAQVTTCHSAPPAIAAPLFTR